MQINQMTGNPIGFGFSMGASSNFLNPVNSKPENSSVSSSKISVSTHQCAQTSHHIAGKILSSEKISHTSDVIKTLRQNPAYMKMSNGELDAIAAAILSVGCVAGGVTLLAVSGGASAPFSIAGLASIVLTSAGCTGATKAIQGAVQGNFNWYEWGRDVAISTGTSLITFGAGYGSAAGVAYLCLNHPSITLTSRAIESIAQVSGAFAGSATRGTTYYVIKECSGERVKTLDLILEIASGALAGAVAGKMAANTQLVCMMRGDVIGHKSHGKGFYKEGKLFTKGNKSMTVFRTKGPIIGQDIYLISQKIKCTTPIGGKVLVISGSHGDTGGSTVLEKIAHGCSEFFEADKNRIIPDALQLRNRSVEVLDLAKFREPGTLCQKILEIKPDVIVTNFCHGDVAMEKGKLGTIITEAFKKM